MPLKPDPLGGGMREIATAIAILFVSASGCSVRQLTRADSRDCSYSLEAIMGAEAHYRAIVQGKNFHAVNVDGLSRSDATDLPFAELSSNASNHWYRVGDNVYVWYVEQFAVRFTNNEYVKFMKAECGDCELQNWAVYPEPDANADCTPVDSPPIAPPTDVKFVKSTPGEVFRSFGPP